MRMRFVLGLALVFALGVATRSTAAPILGQIDDFESGTVENWTAGGGPFGATPPFPPTNIATGGPAGVDDNFLQITATGGGGAGGRLVAMNILGDWAGNYLTSGITAIEMDLINLGASDLALRLLFEDPIPLAPVNLAVSTNPILLPAGGGWTHVVFPIVPGALTAVAGSVDAALMNTTVLRIFHSSTVFFPGEPIVAVVGVDNIEASQLPEPATLALVGIGAAAMIRRRRA